MKKLLLILSVLSLLASSPVLAENGFSSGSYLKYCRESIKLYNGESADKLTAGVCLGYVDGAIGMHHAHTVTDKTNLFYCMPEPSVSSIDAILIWVKYLENNPQKLQSMPLVTFVSSMQEAFPCTESKTK